MIHIPTALEMVDAEGVAVEYLPDDELDHLAAMVIDLHANELMGADAPEVKFLWKAEGGSSGGRSTLGKCKKTSGLERFYAGCDFIIWLAADHCRARSFGQRELEALLFHELKHIGVEVTEKGETKYVIVPHDLEVFLAEIQAYGLWSADIKRLAQLPLFQSAQASPAQTSHFGGSLEARSFRDQVGDMLEGSDFNVDRETGECTPKGEPHLHRHQESKYPAAVCTDPACTIEPRYAVEGSPATAAAR
jgi:hypothetical protein